MSSLTTCSGQGVLVQGKEKEKECIVEDIRNDSSQPSVGGNSPSSLFSYPPVLVHYTKKSIK